MHPSISSFSNKAFYASSISDGTISLETGKVATELAAPSTAFLPENPKFSGVTNSNVDSDQGEVRHKNVGFIHTNDLEGTRSRSIENVGQAEVVVDIVADLLEKNPVSNFKDEWAYNESIFSDFICFSC